MPAHLSAPQSSSMTVEVRGNTKSELQQAALLVGAAYFGVEVDDELLECAPFSARVIYYGADSKPELFAADVRVVLSVARPPAAPRSFRVDAEGDGEAPEDTQEPGNVLEGRFAPAAVSIYQERRAALPRATDDDDDDDTPDFDDEDEDGDEDFTPGESTYDRS